MFDLNSFKRSVKTWMAAHPQGTLTDLEDFCEDQIPPQQFAANKWLVDQTLSWYRHILHQRDVGNQLGPDDDGQEDDTGSNDRDEVA